MKYKELELEDFSPKQKLQMLQTAVADRPEFSNVTHIGAQAIALGNPEKVYEGCMDLLLLAWSSYDREIALSEEHNCLTYTAASYEGNGQKTFEYIFVV
jgi:hypothetical protein